MEAPGSEERPLDALAVGETLANFISRESAISLRIVGKFTRYLGGQPANVAVYVAKLGGRSAVISKVGTDHFGEYIEERIGLLSRVRVENVTGARDAFWSALLVAHLDGKSWEECVLFAYEVATLKLGVEGHVERMINREAPYRRLATPAEQQA